MSRKRSHRKLPSDAQLAANRANAAKSTGPKSPEGKARSSMNAWKHGLTAQSAVLTHENEAEFEHLALAYRTRFLPADPFELHLLDQIILVHWHMDRLRYVQSFHVEQEIYNPDCCAFYPDVDPVIDTHAIPAIAYRNVAEKSRILDISNRELSRLSREYARLNQVFLDIRRNIPINDSGLQPAAAAEPPLDTPSETPAEAPAQQPVQNEPKLLASGPVNSRRIATSSRLITKEVTPDIRAAALPCELLPVTITAGEHSSRSRSGYNVPKRELIVGLQMLFARNELKIPADLPLRPRIIAELTAMTRRLKADSNTHDDLALSLALAAWPLRPRPSIGHQPYPVF